METVAVFLLIAFLWAFIAYIVAVHNNSKLQDTLKVLSDPVFNAEIKPYEYVVYYGLLARKLDTKVDDSKHLLRRLYNNPEYRGEFKSFDEFIQHAKDQHWIQPDYEQPVKYIGLAKLTKQHENYKAFFESFNQR